MSESTGSGQEAATEAAATTGAGVGGVAFDVGAAIALRATPKAYAVLLGSGMSKSAGIPTGYEVLVDLCTRVARANGVEDVAGERALTWFTDSTGQEAIYDRVLAALTGEPAERVGLLRGYFEPTEDQAEQGLKVPSAGHRALAGLVRDGLVRVILTTNFDRLVERALDEIAVPYIVTSSPEAVAGAMPLHLQHCQVIKLHGDFRDPGMLNTPEELSSYAPAVDQLLDQVIDEYGMITIGWSATYDPALRAAIERAPSRRFSHWWVEPGTLSEHAEILVTHRAATVVPQTGDEFLTGVSEAVENLARLDSPAPLTVSLAAAAAKRALRHDGDRIRLHDLLKRELDLVAKCPQVAATTFPGAGVASYGVEVARLEATGASLLALVAVTAYWGDEQTDHWWLPAITTFGARSGRPGASGETSLINLTRYPGCLIHQVAAVAAVAARRWDLFADLARISLDFGNGTVEMPTASYLDPLRVLGGYSILNARSTGVEVNDDPAAHVRGLVQDVVTQHLLLPVADFDQAYETSEYLLQTSSYDWRAHLPVVPDRDNKYAPTRHAGFALAEVDAFMNSTPRISAHVRSLVQPTATIGPVTAGLFAGDPARFTAAADEFDTDFAEHRRRRPFR